jgi:hypothetical protein
LVTKYKNQFSMNDEFLIYLGSAIPKDVLIKYLERALHEYKENPSDENEMVLVSFCGLTMLRFSGKSPEELIQSMKHFKSFNDLSKFTQS